MLKWQSTVGFLFPEKAICIEELIKEHVDENTNCIEVGVFCGKSLMHLLENSKPKHVFAIDPFERNVVQSVMHDDFFGLEIDRTPHYQYDKVIKKFDEFDNVTFIRDYSPLENYPMPEIGYAFIDGDHSKESVLKDAEWIYSLMTEGVIVFDDYAIEGVKEALNIFAQKYNLEINLSKPNHHLNTVAWILVKKG